MVVIWSNGLYLEELNVIHMGYMSCSTIKIEWQGFNITLTQILSFCVCFSPSLHLPKTYVLHIPLCLSLLVIGLFLLCRIPRGYACTYNHLCYLRSILGMWGLRLMRASSDRRYKMHVQLAAFENVSGQKGHMKYCWIVTYNNWLILSISARCIFLIVYIIRDQS